MIDENKFTIVRKIPPNFLNTVPWVTEGKVESGPPFFGPPLYFSQFFSPTFFWPTLVSQFFWPTFFWPTLVSQFFSPTFFLPTPCLSVVAGAPPSCLTSNGRSKQLHGYCCWNNRKGRLFLEGFLRLHFLGHDLIENRSKMPEMLLCTFQ